MKDSIHIVAVTIPQGDPDIGAEFDATITFKFIPGAPAQGPSRDHGGIPADPDELEFISATSKHPSHMGVFADLEEAHMIDVAKDWLDDKGYDAMCEKAREQRAEMELKQRAGEP